MKNRAKLLWISGAIVASIALAVPGHAQTRETAHDFLLPYLDSGSQLKWKSEPYRSACNQKGVEDYVNLKTKEGFNALNEAESRGVGISATVEINVAFFNRLADFLEKVQADCGFDFRGDIAHSRFVAKQQQVTLNYIRQAERRAPARSTTGTGPSLGDVAGFLGGVAAIANAANGGGGSSNAGPTTGDFEVTDPY